MNGFSRRRRSASSLIYRWTWYDQSSPRFEDGFRTGIPQKSIGIDVARESQEMEQFVYTCQSRINIDCRRFFISQTIDAVFSKNRSITSTTSLMA